MLADDNSITFGCKEVESLSHYFLKHNLSTHEEIEAIPQEWPFLKSYITYICSQPIVDIYQDLLVENYHEVQNNLVLIQLMVTISPSITACESSFLAMNREKTSLQALWKNDRLKGIYKFVQVVCYLLMYGYLSLHNSVASCFTTLTNYVKGDFRKENWLIIVEYLEQKIWKRNTQKSIYKSSSICQWDCYFFSEH